MYNFEISLKLQIFGTALLWESCSVFYSLQLSHNMSVLKISSFWDIYIYKLTMSISPKLYIFGSDMLWESCLFCYSEQLSQSNAVSIFVSLGDIDIVSLYI